MRCTIRLYDLRRDEKVPGYRERATSSLSEVSHAGCHNAQRAKCNTQRATRGVARAMQRGAGNRVRFSCPRWIQGGPLRAGSAYHCHLGHIPALYCGGAGGARFVRAASSIWWTRGAARRQQTASSLATVRTSAHIASTREVMVDTMLLLQYWSPVSTR